MLDFRYLPAFLALAESRNFTEAGKRLHIATSAVSRQIRLLEESCGTSLFFRSAREAVLTESGKQLLKELQLFRAGADRVLDTRSPATLRIGALEGVLQNWLLTVLADRRFPPEVNLDIRVAHPGELVDAVEAGELDATFFSYVHRTRIPAALQVTRVFREEIVLISDRKIALSDVDDFPWVLYTRNTYLVRYAKKLAARHIVVNHMGAVVDLVRQGRGIAMVPSHVLRERKGLHVLPVKKFSAEYVYLVSRRQEREPDPLRIFRTLVSNHSHF